MNNRKKKLRDVVLLVLALILLMFVLILFAHPAKAESQSFYVKEDVRERMGPTTNSEIVLVRTRGEQLEVRSISDGWAKLKNGHYVCADYLTDNPSGLFRNQKLWVIVDVSNVRSGPSKRASVIGQRNFGESVTVTGKEGEWYSIKEGGFIHESCIYANIENYFRDKYSDVIFVSISGQTLRYYLNNELLTSGDICSGKNSTPTPLGSYVIERIHTDEPMSGKVADFAMYFDYSRGYAIHNAPWRSHFGGSRYKENGSLGCVNTRYKMAEIIHDNCRVNVTRVIIYD